MKGFKINRLVSIGETVEPKIIEFTSGLNLIIGPSDTGKTYIFEAINYLLGSGSLPKSINQATHYSNMFLEIEKLSSNAIFTISRSLLSSTEDIVIYESKYSEIDSANFTLLHYESNKSKPNISGFLLEKCGFDSSARIRADTNYKKESFTFRSYIPYSMVSETKMIAENSPIYDTNNYSKRTTYLYQFKYLITHKDDSEFEETPKRNIFDASKNANIDLLNELLESENEKRKNLISRIGNCEASAESNYVNTLLLDIQKQITELNKIIYEIEQEQRQEVESIRYNKSVLERFAILKQQYLSDIERLQFIDEGSFLINQFATKKCPNCGEEIEFADNDSEYADSEMISFSCNYEISQIELKLNELDESMKTTQSFLSKSEQKKASLQKKLDDNYDKLNNTLNPELTSLNEKLIEITNIDKAKSELSLIEEKIKQYADLISNFNDKKFSTYSSPNQFALDLIQNTSFKETLEDAIKSFYSQEDVNIELYFNKNKELDFKINNISRISRGKGSRALLASAFFIAVRKYCEKTDYPHANFLILDSPINAFKDLKENEKLESSIKNKFLKYLSSENIQTIIMENIDPNDISDDIRKNINIIQFTKSPNNGRYGFY